MAIKIYNPETKQWEIQASPVATGIKVVDLSGNYTSDTVNGCLEEIAEDIKGLDGRVKYIEENGTMNGGGGGNGSVTPTVTLDGVPTVDGKPTITVKSTDVIDIYYFFTSPNMGNGIASLSYGSSSTNVSIPQGRNKWTIGPFAKGSYILTILVQDSQGFWSSAVQVTVISGSLELSSTFVDTNDFTMEDDIVINYNITTLVSEAVFLDYWFNDIKTTIPVNVGANQLKIGKLPFMGVSTLKMEAHNASYTSNALNFTLVASNSTTLYTSTTFPTNQIGSTLEVGKNLQIDYRVSMRNQYSFNTTYYIDGVKVADVISKPGVNYWNVGNDLEPRDTPYVFKIVTSTTDGTQFDDLEIRVTIVAADYIPYRHVRTNLIAEFNASGKLNNSLTKNVWEDASGNNVLCNLYNFNYSTNGWHENALRVSGKSYAVIDLAPFAQGIKDGLTFEILFKTTCVGNIDAKVVSCKNPVTPFQGLEINSWQAKMTSKASDTVQSNIQDDTWTKVSYVVNRLDKTMIMYVNGIISNVSYLSPNNPTMPNYDDEFKYDGKIYIGAALSAANQVINNSVSNIKSIRVYNRALTDDEVLQNFIADETDKEKQLALRALNTTTEGIPTLNITGNLNEMDEDSERQCTITYNDPANPSKTFSKDYCTVSWQGTSSKTYPVKNWTIKLKDGGQPWLTYAPKDEWKPEDRWTIKANYVDSSNANNIGLNKFIRDFFEPYPYPCEVTDTTTRPNVDGFVINLKLNGEFVGLHTWNVDRYAPNNYGFVTYNEDGTITRHPNAVSYEIAVNSTTGAGAFKNKSWDSIKTEFKHRYNYRETSGSVTETIKINNVDTTVLKTGMHNELVDLVTWLVDCTDQEFLTELDEHFSVQHLIDYYIIAYVLGMVDNLGKNMVLSTWGKNGDGNTIWYPAFYDCDSVLGLDNTGYVRFNAGLDMLNNDYNTSDSKLWVMLNKHYGKQISDRYKELRLTRTINGATLPPILSYENIIKYLGNEVIDKVGQKFYNQDARLKYINDAGKSWLHMCNGTRREFTERWLKERFIYMDSVFEFNFESKAVIRSNVLGVTKLRFKTYSPQWVTVQWTNATDAVVKKQVGKEYWTEFEWDLANGTDNNIEIYGVNNVMYIDGLKDLNAGSINIAQAEKLIELDISNSTHITQLSLGTNSYLNKLNCSNCVNLGYQVANRTLDVSSCVNLIEFDCHNTHIANIKFNDVGGVLETLNVSNTDITTFTLVGQEYLPSIDLDGCGDLSYLVIRDCNGLTDVSMTDTKLNSVEITGCNNLEYLDLSRTRNLVSFNISGCPSIKTLKMANVSNPALTEIDLSYAPVLEYLDISASSYIQTLTFPQFPVTYTTQKIDMVNGIAIIPKKFVVQNSISVRLTDEGTALSNSTDYIIAVDATTGYTIITRKTTGTIPANQKYVYVTYSHNSCLTTLKCDSSAIKALRYGRNAVIPTYLDLNGLPLTDANFYSCTNLTEVRNINFVASGSTSIFYNCYNLITITGKLTLRDSIYRAFYNCKNLVNLPTLDLSAVTNGEDAFMYCEKLTAVQANLILQAMTDKFTSQWRMFYGCKGITGNFFQTYPNLFSKCTKLTTLHEMFVNCTGIIGTIPATLLQPMGSSLVSCEEAFYSTNISGEVPNTLLSYSPNLISTAYMFYNTDVTAVDLANLFSYNTKLQSAAYMFGACTLLVTTLNEGMFKNNKDLYNIVGMFAGCTKLTGSIPQDIFNNIQVTLVNGIYTNKLRNIDYFLSGTNITGTIPAANSSAGIFGLLDKCYQLESADYLFNGLSGLSGSIPTDFFKNNNNLIRASGTFQDCSSLSGVIPPQLLRGKTKLTKVNNLFYRCGGIQSSIPEGFLNDCPLVTDTSKMFYECTGLNGYIPSRESIWTTKETVPINTQIVLTLENPILPSFVVRLNSSGAELSNVGDYSATIDELGRVIITRLTNGVIPATQQSLYVTLAHAVSMTGGVAKIIGTNINQSSLIVKPSDSSSTTYNIDTDYTLSTDSSGNVVITRVATGLIPESQPVLSVKYDRTISLGKNITIDTLNIDLGSVFVKLTSSSALLQLNVDYTIEKNLKTGYVEIKRVNSGNIPYTQELIYVTYKHIDNNIKERNEILDKANRSTVDSTENVTKYGLLDNLVNLTTTALMFYGCKSLTSNIPPKLFMSGDKINTMSGMFSQCFLLSGGIPEGLLDNCKSLVYFDSVFQDCISLRNPIVEGGVTYLLPIGFFDKCLNLNTIAYLFCMWGSHQPLTISTRINGELHPDLFKNNLKLVNISTAFVGCELNGVLDSNLFKYNTLINNAYATFHSTNITAIGENLFRTCTALKNMEWTFQSCVQLTGYAPAYWSAEFPIHPTTFAACFRGCTKLTNYNSIPADWK